MAVNNYTRLVIVFAGDPRMDKITSLSHGQAIRAQNQVHQWRLPLSIIRTVKPGLIHSPWYRP